MPLDKYLKFKTFKICFPNAFCLSPFIVWPCQSSSFILWADLSLAYEDDIIWRAQRLAWVCVCMMKWPDRGALKAQRQTWLAGGSGLRTEMNPQGRTLEQAVNPINKEFLRSDRILICNYFWYRFFNIYLFDRLGYILYSRGIYFI